MRVLALVLLIGFTPAHCLAQNFTATRIATIGCAACGGPEELGTIQSLQLSRRGLLIIDNSPPFFREFSLDGKLIRAFGNRGGGPAEFRLPLGALFTADNRTLAVDMRAQRIVMLSQELKEISSARLEQLPLAVGASTTALYIAGTDFISPGHTVMRFAAGRSPATVMKLDTLFPRGTNGGPAIIFPFAVGANDQIAVADGGEYRIRIYDAYGAVQRSVTRPLARLKKTTAELAEERQRLDRVRARASRMRAAEGGAGPAGAIEPYPLKSQVRALSFDETGRLFVLTGRGGPAESIIDVFSGAGALVGELRIPSAAHAISAHGGMVALAGEDEEGAPVVTLWRISRK